MSIKCPKCQGDITKNTTVCPHCHKVLVLECPNCHAINETPVCEKCGFIILVKCSKCSKLNHVNQEFCSKCKFPVKTSIANQECESDEFAALNIKFNSLKHIKKALKTRELYLKFFNKLKNLLLTQLKSSECKLITYGDSFEVNFNKELSFETSANKAVRIAIKIINLFSELNIKV